MWREVAPWEGQSPTTITVDFQARMWRKPGASPLSLRTRQLNRFADPARYFFLEGSMMGIPLKGLHIYENAHASMLVRLAGKLRGLKGQDLEEGVSTRLVIYAATLIAGGMPVERAIHAAMIEPLTDDADTRKGLWDLVVAVTG